MRLPVRPAGPRPAQVLPGRLELLAETIGADRSGGSAAQAPLATRAIVEDFLTREGPDAIWLVSSVLHARFPDPSDVTSAHRTLQLDGARAVLEALEESAPEAMLGSQVRIVTGRTLVDVHQLARSPFTTGIQRVAQETTRRWARDHDVDLVVWTPDLDALREATPQEEERALGASAGTRSGTGTTAVVVPWQARYLLPEIGLDRDRTRRTRGLVLHSRSRTGAIAFDMVPITMAETTDTGVSSDFAQHLAAARHMDRLAAISGATREEYEGWRTMISAAGYPGPEIGLVALPVEARVPTPQALERMRQEYVVPGSPLVLCVGSHEPRKNHVAVLHAVEALWRRGEAVTLLFVGGNSWGGSDFRRRFAELVAVGRDVRAETNVDEDDLWALYQLARCTVFPSLSEGFGLPVAESLAAGTPVVTADFGSMAEIAAGGGALMTDPRDPLALADALSRLVRDDDLHARLSTAARARPHRGWEDYAREAWDYLAGVTA